MPRTRWAQMAVVAAAAAAALVPAPRWFIDGVYAARAFPWLQWHLTGATNLVPFAALDVLLLAAVAWLAWGAAAVVRAGKGKRLTTFWRWEWRHATVIAAGYLAFLAGWGFNYQRPPLSASLDYADSRVTPESVRAFGDVALQEVSRHRGALGDGPLVPEGRRAVAAGLEAPLGLVAGMLRLPRPVRAAVPKLTILDLHYTRAGVSGMTDPIFLETFVASNLLPHELPVVVAHEWAHLAGFARESEASFFGWLVCIRGDERARYSGWLSMLLRAVAALPRDERRALVGQLPQAVRDDLEAARLRDERDQVRLVTSVSQKTYDQYLKANRVQSGIRNYGEVLELAVGTRFNAGWSPVLR